MQSLMPAFSQLQLPGKEEEYNALFARSIRLTIIWLLPVIMLMFIGARPFLTLWAGEDFGRESTLPLHILLAGLFFSILASAPHATITAAGRSDIFAKLYWAELVVYLFVAWFLVSYFGIAGAAMAWSVRVILDAFAVIYLSKRVASVRFSFLSHGGSLAFAALVLIVPVLVTLYVAPSPLLIGIALIAIGLYALIIWKQFIRDDERAWISARLNNLLEFHK
jgi:O-antigen/teichoic acid export membrane protein